ncbi:MAG: glycosyltransferase family 2 protein [Devosia sp.]|uniref:glycosyltransferase family 2 protein n=1 Tax=Devosia sp. TaxID=1871048 RepID=UPI0026325C60|nr:glycosyltransferase family A protein [Devosia sp.]MDB5587806.1 glycosyltransferase family 2 protein [Devosia sp.]
MAASNPTVAVITPAFAAMGTLVTTVRSVLAQTYPHWELVIVSDDGVDYLRFLAEHGMADSRIGQLSSGKVGGGASAARNLALDAITAPYAAILDADDRLKPQKLERAVAALEHHGIVTTALDVMDEQFNHLRDVAAGPDRELTPGAHKWVNVSMDSMVVWDRAKADARYDLTMSNMTDLELLLQLYRTVPASFHLGTPLHDYIKRAGSMSNGEKTAAGMVASKTTLLQRLGSGYYPLAPGGVEGMAEFLAVSLEAEKHYTAALAAQPGLLFEDHLEPRLEAKKQAAP